MTGAPTLKTKSKRQAQTNGATARGPSSADEYVFRLFVAGATARSQQAILQLHELTEKMGLPGRVRIEVIDIYQQPGMARRHQIVATPTLIVVLPKPVRRFIGSVASLPELFLEFEVGSERRLLP